MIKLDHCSFRVFWFNISYNSCKVLFVDPIDNVLLGNNISIISGNRLSTNITTSKSLPTGSWTSIIPNGLKEDLRLGIIRLCINF